MLKSGDGQSFTKNGEDYSTDTEVRGLLKKSRTNAELKRSLEEVAYKDVAEELLYYTSRADPGHDMSNSDPSSYKFGKPMDIRIQAQRFRDVEILSWDGGELKLEGLNVYPETYKDLIDPQFPWRVRVGDTGWISKEGGFPMKQFAHSVPYTRPDAWIVDHPLKALKEVLALGHDLHPGEIGPPYVFVFVSTTYANDEPSPKAKRASKRTRLRVRKPIVRWITEGRCPSWSENIWAQPSVEPKRVSPLECPVSGDG